MKRKGPTILAERKSFEQANIRCARIILENREKHPAFQVEWAEMVLSRMRDAGDSRPATQSQGTLEGVDSGRPNKTAQK